MADNPRPPRSGGSGRPSSSGRSSGGPRGPKRGDGPAQRGASGRPAAGGPRPQRRDGTPDREPRREGRHPEPREERGPRRPPLETPELAEDVTPGALDPVVRRQLKTLPMGLADLVARHLVAADRALEDDPELAYRHTSVAVRLASRVPAVREAAGVTAYRTARWAQALSELRAARRMSGSLDFLPMMADCERGLGRPERALTLAGSPEASRLDRAGRVEMRIVTSGARRDMGQLDAAVLALQCPELRDARQPWSARLFYAYADALLAADRADEAREWFTKAAEADLDDVTGAAERLAELDGVVYVDLEDAEDAED